MTKEFKRHIACPHCKKPIHLTITTSGTWAFVKTGKSMKDQEDFEVWLKEVIEKTVRDMDTEGFFDHDHTKERRD